MLARFLITVITICLLVAAVAAKVNALDPKALMAKSDVAYYFPTANGLKDMAVDLVIDELADNPIAKQAKISYYYAGADEQQFTVTNIDAKYDDVRRQLLAVVLPLGDYLIPKTSASTFAGLKLSVQPVYRELAGVSDTAFYQLIGKSSDADADVKEYHVLLDKDGLAHQVENVMKDNSVIVAQVENVRNGNHWQISKVTTRMLSSMEPEWKIDSIEYQPVDGFSLPSRITIQYRDNFNRPITGMSDLTIHFVNYRINQGVAAATLSALQTPAPAATPVPAAPTPAAPAAK